MNEMIITNAQYLLDPLGDKQYSSIRAIVNGQEMYIPLDPANRHYAEIMRQVEAGTLVIAEAE